eukprot:1671627-Prymnesium_polylepis.2
MSPSSWRRISAKSVKDTMVDKQDKCGMVLCCIEWVRFPTCQEHSVRFLSVFRQAKSTECAFSS